MFEEVRKILENIFGNGFVKRNNKSPNDFATCNGVAEEDVETNTCNKCVALNHTIFKIGNVSKFGHRYCKCWYELKYFNGVILDFPMRKVTNYLFADDDKRAMMHTMGYTAKDSREIYNFIEKAVKTKFMLGEYELKDLNENGQHFRIYVELPGKDQVEGKKYMCHVGCVAWPEGRIKIATPLLKDKEIMNEVVGSSGSTNG